MPHTSCRSLLRASSLSANITHAYSIQKIESSTIQAYLAGISFIIKLLPGHYCPSSYRYHVSMLIKGLRKQEPALSAKPTSDLLCLCIRSLRSGHITPTVHLTHLSSFIWYVITPWSLLQPELVLDYHLSHHPNWSYFCSDDWGGISEGLWARKHESSLHRSLILTNKPSYWISVIDWVLQLIRQIWYIRTSLN